MRLRKGGERMGSKSAVEICCQKRIEKVRTFWNFNKELSETEPFSAIKNNPNTRKAYGIDRILKNKKNPGGRSGTGRSGSYQLVIKLFLIVTIEVRTRRSKARCTSSYT